LAYGRIGIFPFRTSERRHGGKLKMVLCDTNVLIEALKKNPSAIQSLEEIGLDSIAVSVITVMELYYGALNKAELVKIKHHLSSVQIVQIDEEISVTGATLIERYAKSHGLQIPDALIAAAALCRDLQLFTENTRDFIFIENIRLWSPAKR